MQKYYKNISLGIDNMNINEELINEINAVICN
jgi:hypothetical protein